MPFIPPDEVLEGITSLISDTETQETDHQLTIKMLSSGVTYIIEPLTTMEIIDVEKKYGLIIKTSENNKSHVLASGNFGRFVLAKRIETDGGEKSMVGVKIIPEEKIDSSLMETVYSHRKNKPHVIQFFDSTIMVGKDNKQYLYHFMPLGGLGNLKQLMIILNYISKQDKKLKEWVITYTLMNMLKGVLELHDDHLFHLDLKLENFILELKELKKTKKTIFFARVLDLGNAVSSKDKEPLLTNQDVYLPEGLSFNNSPIEIGASDVEYWSPERTKAYLNKSSFDMRKADCFCLGLTLLNLIIGENCNQENITYKMLETRLKEAYELCPELTNIAKELLSENPPLISDLLGREIFLQEDLHDELKEENDDDLDKEPSLLETVTIILRKFLGDNTKSIMEPAFLKLLQSETIIKTLPKMSKMDSIPLMISNDPEGKQQELLMQATEAWLHSSKIMLFIIGEAGAGKTTFCREFILKQIEKANHSLRHFQAANGTFKEPIPIYIRLPSSQGITKSEKLLEHVLEKNYQLTQEEIVCLKALQQPLVLFLETNDESHANNYVQGNWQEWNIKVIEFRRTKPKAISTLPYQTNTSILADEFSETFYIQPLNREQKNQFMAEFIKKEINSKDSSIEQKTYIEMFKKFDMEDLMETPLTFYLLMKVIPKQEQETEQKYKWLKVDIIKNFLEDWYKRKNDLSVSLDEVDDFRRRLAYAMFCKHEYVLSTKVSIIKYDEEKHKHVMVTTIWEPYLRRDQKTIKLRSFIPLNQTAEEVSFEHHVFLEYSFAESLYLKIKTSDFTQAEAVKKITSEDFWFKIHVCYPSVVKFLADWAKKDDVFVKKITELVSIIKDDKDHEKLVPGFISILASSHVSLDKMDLKKNALYYADLTRVDDLKTVFTDVTHLDITNAKFQDGVTCIVTQPHLSYFMTGHYNGSIKKWNIQTGTLLQSIQCFDDGINHLALSANEKWLAVSAINNVDIYEMTDQVIIRKDHVKTDAQIHALHINNEGQLYVSQEKKASYWTKNKNGNFVETSGARYGEKFLNNHIGDTLVSQNGKYALVSRIHLGLKLSIMKHWLWLENLNNLQLNFIEESDEYQPLPLASNLDGTEFLLRGKNNFLEKWELTSHKDKPSFKKQTYTFFPSHFLWHAIPMAAAFDPQNRWIIVGDSYGNIRIWFNEKETKQEGYILEAELKQKPDTILCTKTHILVGSQKLSNFTCFEINFIEGKFKLTELWSHCFNASLKDCIFENSEVFIQPSKNHFSSAPSAPTFFSPITPIKPEPKKAFDSENLLEKKNSDGFFDSKNQNIQSFLDRLSVKYGYQS